ncbi:glycosyl hydrolase catalytic core-domain-containing protein [Diaporthe sp. PMI_573]|nr:glycosyl hydrolase catalytic core-domain-containing protein [Diaporthaceae sp. PMI_573]
MRRTTTTSSAFWANILLLPFAVSQESDSASKRGLAYIGDAHEGDVDLLLSPNSRISWYYTWSAYPVQNVNSTLTFVPLIHGVDDASSPDVQGAITSLPATSTHLLAFNEPDGTTSSGGSSISPSDAARAYIDNIVPLRTSSSRSWNISHPSVTGSGNGLNWLRDFNEACWDIDPDNGCPTDFVALHWYGNFEGLASWVGTMREYYTNSSDSGAVDPDNLKFWITEMALPQQDEDDTVAMMNQSLSYLDSLDYVESYSWFGAFRKDNDVNGFVGDNVALFDDDGGLTDAGALYLGGEEAGFEEGMKGSASGLGGSGSGSGLLRASLLAVLAAAITTVVNL